MAHLHEGHDRYPAYYTMNYPNRTVLQRVAARRMVRDSQTGLCNTPTPVFLWRSSAVKSVQNGI